MVRNKPVRERHFNYWRRLLQSDVDKVFTIKYRGCHIGNCGIKNINLENGDGEIWLYLGAQKMRGRGIGRKVVCELLKHCRNLIRLKKVFLNVRESNSAAYNLYTSMSFRAVGSTSENFDSRFGVVKRMERSI
jgi:RimJ/RimL family protein N-acetyltransferase